MSYEKIRSMSRILKTEDGKFTVEVTAACNNIVPLHWHKCKFHPYDSEEELIGSILEGIWGGSLHFQCKSKYQTFMDEIQYGIHKSPAYDEIKRLYKWHNVCWDISSKNGHWNPPNANPAMREKCTALQRKLAQRREEQWIPLAREFKQWKPDTSLFTVRIDGNRVTKFTHNRSTYRTSWRYAQSWNTTSPSKVFTAVEAAKVKEILKDRATIEPIGKQNERDNAA